ncbi:MAG: SU10 major capsid protein [Actinomycetota bacterium]
MSNELREALTAANVTALIPKQIDPLLLEYVRRYSPLVYATPTIPWGTNTYFFNQRTALGRGGFTTDGGARSVTTSTYVQTQFGIKLLQSVGAVTGFSQAVTRGVIGDLKAKEIEGNTQGLVWDVETAMLWGNANATANQTQPMFDGLDYQVNSFSGNIINCIDQGENALTLAMLDQLINLVEANASRPLGSDWMFVMSPAMESKVAQLLVNQQRFMGQATVAAGLNVTTYRDTPIIKSSFLSPRTQAMGTVTTGTATTGGTLAAATYYYKVSAVMERFGEIQASAEVSQVTSGSTSKNTLTFSAPSGPDGAQPVLYKVYRSTSTGTETLLGAVDGTDVNGATVTSITDDGANIYATNNSVTVTYANAGSNTSIKPRNGIDEDIYLIPRDQNFLVRPYVRDFFVLPLAATKASPDELPFAILSDTTLAVRGPKYVGRLLRTVSGFTN